MKLVTIVLAVTFIVAAFFYVSDAYNGTVAPLISSNSQGEFSNPFNTTGKAVKTMQVISAGDLDKL